MNWYKTSQNTKQTALQKLLKLIQQLGGFEAAKQLAKTPDNQLTAGVNNMFTKMRKFMLINLLCAVTGVAFMDMIKNTDFYLAQLAQNQAALLDANGWQNHEIENASDTVGYNHNWTQYDNLPQHGLQHLRR